MTRVWAPRDSRRVQVPPERAARRRSETGCREGGAGAGRPVQEHRCFNPAQLGGRRRPEAGTRSLIQVPTGPVLQQGALGKPSNLCKITDTETSSPVPGAWLTLNRVQNMKV